ncbi:MAG TPA: SprT family zinc-dependent metalloprotease, partial [Terriglobales bacterium]|nr:SprT family zinc-dependent metalloprotease [Terriglobales bacterium]
APLAVSDSAVRVAVIGKLGWIRRQRATFAQQPRESRREMVSGESHWYRGRRYRLRVVEGEGTPRVELRGHQSLILHVRPGSTTDQREQLLQRWYRDRLREVLPELIENWQATLGVNLQTWGIKRMKTKWGSCNDKARRIWLNLELIKKPPSCLEYVVVHELIHLRLRKHDRSFLEMMVATCPRGAAAVPNSMPRH